VHLTVLSTGGTIASTAGETGASPTMDGDDLLADVTDVPPGLDISVEAVAQVPSFEVDRETLTAIGDRVSALAAADATDAVVLTHGTDTMEETAYYLDVVHRPSVPVVLTGAQRRPDETSPDGPANLRSALLTAFAFREFGGVFVAFDDEVHAAQTVTKTHTTALGTFQSPDAGPVASLDHDGVHLHRKPQSESLHVPDASLEPTVYTVKCGGRATGDLVDAAIERGADGLVVEGTGVGNVPPAAGRAVVAALDDGIPTVLTSRCQGGRTIPIYDGVGGGARLDEHGAIFAGSLPSQKARIALTLAIDACDGPAEIRSLFDEA